MKTLTGIVATIHEGTCWLEEASIPFPIGGEFKHSARACVKCNKNTFQTGINPENIVTFLIACP